MMEILLTAPPMINRLEQYREFLKKYNLNVFVPSALLSNKQTLNENELLEIIGDYDIWIIGDDPATINILEKGKKNNLKMVVKWGIGTDNIDLECIQKLDLKFTNTPAMFNEEVSDVAIGYLIMLTRHLHKIHQEVKIGHWYKPIGESISGKNAAIIGFGNIGRSLYRKLSTFGLNIKIFDPFVKNIANVFDDIEFVLSNVNFIIITCALTETSKHLINNATLSFTKRGCYIINVSRGGIILEKDLIQNMRTGHIQGTALDVFEEEPLPINNELRLYNCIFGSHNASNTREAVDRTSYKVLDFIVENI